MGPHGLWIGLVTALTMGAVLLLTRLRIIVRRNNTQDAHPAIDNCLNRTLLLASVL